LILLKQREWINRARAGIHTVVQVRRRAARIAGITHIPHDIAGYDDISGLELTESVQVRIVVHLPPGTEDQNHIAAQPVLA
jgi:hypothetical protein